VARLLLAVPVLLAVLAVPVSEGAFDPQPALITLISATIAKAASGRSVLLMVAPWCVENWADTGSLSKRAHHRCILGSCVGSAYMAGQP
jgi:hypothetical protein